MVTNPSQDTQLVSFVSSLQRRADEMLVRSSTKSCPPSTRDSWSQLGPFRPRLAADSAQERSPRVETDLQGEQFHSRGYIGSAVQALTLLEYLVKNGSERVVDDARAHVSTIKMLRSFHYIDEKGKDQGINGQLLIP